MFAVIWRDIALDELADAYVRADLPTRDTVERAVEQFNSELALAPTTVGESRIGDFRVAFSAPVAILFHVDLVAATVQVVHFWTY